MAKKVQEAETSEPELGILLPGASLEVGRLLGQRAAGLSSEWCQFFNISLNNGGLLLAG